jgi:hypothetical protein
MMLGIMEAIMHVAMIGMFRLKHFYSPGLATAVVLLLPISLYTFAYAIRHDLMQPVSWLFALLYMLFGLIIAQQIVIRASGMKIYRVPKKRQSGSFRRSPLRNSPSASGQ